MIDYNDDGEIIGCPMVPEARRPAITTPPPAALQADDRGAVKDVHTELLEAGPVQIRGDNVAVNQAVRLLRDAGQGYTAAPAAIAALAPVTPAPARAQLIDTLNLFYAMGQAGEPNNSAEFADRMVTPAKGDDGARYRWLRDHPKSRWSQQGIYGKPTLLVEIPFIEIERVPVNLDKVIDAAMAQSQDSPT